MKNGILKTEIDTPNGLAQGCIVLSNVTMFREHKADCNRTIIETVSGVTYSIYMKYSEFYKKIALNYAIY